jgi:galactose-1-phosphate uridylyltransferase
MKKQLSKERLSNLLQADKIEDLTLEQIEQFFLEETDIAAFAPDGICQTDPRSGDRIVYNSARARRPHDNRSAAPKQGDSEKKCLICQGKTTRIIDKTELSEGFTFINKNLYPIFYPSQKTDKQQEEGEAASNPVEGAGASGFHFLQWTSSYHDRDWHNMPLSDSLIVLKRLAALEKKLLEGRIKYVSIIKNYGHLVGGSLVHGHQQIGASNIMPNRYRQNKIFQDEHDETFSAFMVRENPKDLLIRDYGPAVLITPYFMRRPYDMMLIIKDSRKSYLHMLDEEECGAAVKGWRDAIRIILTIMPQIDKEIAYNVVTHNGPGAGLYFEFLPYTQEMGGFEHLGLYLCQGNPSAAAAHAREVLESDLMERFGREDADEG